MTLWCFLFLAGDEKEAVKKEVEKLQGMSIKDIKVLLQLA
jgi:hypothetical protein